MRLGFHYHIPALARNGGIYLPGYLGRFLDSLAAGCEELVCFLHAPLPSESGFMDYRLVAPNITLLDIGPHVSVPQRLLHAGKFTQPLREWRHRLDAILLRGPSPLLPAMGRAAQGLPLALLIVGDYLAGVNDLPQPRWRKEAIRLFSWWNYRQQLSLAKRNLTMVNSRLLYEQLRPLVPNLHEVRTTTLTSQDFYYREDTCQTRPIHLLYTGRMDRAKGLFDMVEAVALLVAQGEDVVLDLVGWPAEHDTIMEEIFALAAARGVAARVHYHGYKKVGAELFEYYKQADIYVIASRSSEGFPRTIWEAMAHSLPVVATKVGAIPFFLRDAALLIKPGDPVALSNAILRLLENNSMRQGLITLGRTLAQQNTLETQIVELTNLIREWLA